MELNCYDIFMRHISGGRGMLKSLCNHKAGSAACRYYHNQPEDSMADNTVALNVIQKQRK